MNGGHAKYSGVVTDQELRRTKVTLGTNLQMILDVSEHFDSRVS